jgi:hypothetical protein
MRFRGRSLVRWALIAAGGLAGLRPAPALESHQLYEEETGLGAWKSSLHFTVYARDQDTTGRVLAALEETHRRVAEELNITRAMAARCLVFVWPDKKEYIRRADQFYPGDIESAQAFFKLGKEGESASIYLYESDDLLTESLPHELSHLILEVVIDPLRKYPIPVWLHEGFAQAHETGDWKQDLLSVQTARRRGRLIPIRKLLRMKFYPSDAVSTRLLYLEAEALIRFLLAFRGEPGEFFDFCSQVLFWKDDPEKVLPKRWGGEFPDAAALEGALLKWADEQTRGVSFAEDNTFLQPTRRHALARRRLDEAWGREQAGEIEKALAASDLAMSEVGMLRREDPEWNRAAAVLLEKEIKEMDARLRRTRAGAQGEEGARRRFSLDRPFEFVERQVRNAFGEPSSLGKIKLVGEASGRGGDRFGVTFARYNDQGLYFIFRQGLVIGVTAFEPFAGEMCGIRIGQPKEEALESLRRRNALREPANPTKYWWVDFPDREAELIFKDDRLQTIQIHKKDPLGRRYQWQGY